MSKTLTFEIADEVSAALEEMSIQTGRAFEDLVLEWLVKHRAARTPSTRERQGGLQRLRRHAGAVCLGHPTATDNESIDADLVREYGSLSCGNPGSSTR